MWLPWTTTARFGGLIAMACPSGKSPGNSVTLDGPSGMPSCLRTPIPSH